MIDVHALSGAYAVDALDDLERAKFERHLSECLDCREEVASLREASALLASTADARPPASLRASVLAGIEQVRPLPPLVPEPVAATPRRRWQGLLAVAAAVTVIGSGAVIVQNLADDASSQNPPTLTVAEQVLRDNDAKRVVQEFKDGSTATMVVSRKLGKAVVVTEGMAPAPDGSVYELWYQRGDTMVPAGLMPDDPDATVLLDGDATKAQAVGITLEPEDEPDDEPTLPPLATFPIEV